MEDDAPRRIEWIRDYVVILPGIAVLFGWIAFIFGHHKRGQVSAFSTASVLALAAVLLFVLLFGLVTQRGPTPSGLISIALNLILVLNVILLLFSGLYWAYGTT